MTAPGPPRIELTDDQAAAVLADALAGRNLTRREARQLAATLRAVVEALPPGTGNLAGLSRRLGAAADILEGQPAPLPRRRRA